MKTMKLRAVLLALLLAGMAMVPCVSAEKDIDMNKMQISELIQDKNLQNTVITGPLGTQPGDDIYAIPEGSIIYHSSDGITRIFDQEGKQIIVASDDTATKVTTPNGLVPATHVYAVPQGARILDSRINTGTTYVLTEIGDLVITVIDESSKKDLAVTRASTIYNSNWLAWAYKTVSQISYLRSTWYTPSPPSTSGALRRLLWPFSTDLKIQIPLCSPF